MQINPNFWNCTKIDMCKGVKLKLPHAMQNEIFEQMLQNISVSYTILRETTLFPTQFQFFSLPKRN